MRDEIERTALGIEGIDDMVKDDGIPKNDTVAVVGSEGSGKTTMALEYIPHGLKKGQNCVFISLEKETKQKLIQSAENREMEFHKHMEEGSLKVLDLNPYHLASSISNIRSQLPKMVENFGADRMAIDSITRLEDALYKNERTKIHRMIESINRSGASALITSESDPHGRITSRSRYIEYVVNGVIYLQKVETTRGVDLTLWISKLRETNHTRDKKLYELTSKGIEVLDTELGVSKPEDTP